MICAARESGAKRTEKGIAGESRCRKATGLNGASRTTAGLPKTENSPSSGPQGQEGGFFYEREEVRQVVFDMIAGSHHGADFASCQHAGDGRAGRGGRRRSCAGACCGRGRGRGRPCGGCAMLLATPAAADTPIAVPTDKLFFDKANGVITGIDADWLAENKDKPLSVTIPAEIGGVAVTSIGQNAFNGKKLLLSISAMQPIWRRSTIRHLCTLRWHRLTCPILR